MQKGETNDDDYQRNKKLKEAFPLFQNLYKKIIISMNKLSRYN
jgi:hypothetical protein